MTCCTDVHKQFDRFANGKVQVGELPEWTHVHGKVAWFVYQGPYSELGSEGFNTFGRDLEKRNLRWMVPPEMFMYAVQTVMKKTNKLKC